MWVVFFQSTGRSAASRILQDITLKQGARGIRQCNQLIHSNGQLAPFFHQLFVIGLNFEWLFIFDFCNYLGNMPSRLVERFVTLVWWLT